MTKIIDGFKDLFVDDEEALNKEIEEVNIVTEEETKPEYYDKDLTADDIEEVVEEVEKKELPILSEDNKVEGIVFPELPTLPELPKAKVEEANSILDIITEAMTYSDDVKDLVTEIRDLAKREKEITVNKENALETKEAAYAVRERLVTFRDMYKKTVETKEEAQKIFVKTRTDLKNASFNDLFNMTK